MRYGICTGPEHLADVASAGFDYAEFSLNAIAAMTDSDFESLLGQVARSSIKPEALNGFFPWQMRIVGPEADPEAIDTYIVSALARAARLGIRVCVVGNGGARRVPDGMPLEEGLRQFRDVLRRIGDAAAPLGIEIAIEPLNAAESNIVLSMEDGAALTGQVGHPQVRLLADFYHMRRNGEPMETLTCAQGILRHVHIANSQGRIYPANLEEDLYAPFFSMLDRIGYDGRISVEASTADLAADAPRALSMLRLAEAAARAGNTQ